MAKTKQKKSIHPKIKKRISVKLRVAEQQAEYNTKSSSQSALSLDMLKKNSSLDLMDINEASKWASIHMGKNVTPSNISYLIQYGRIKKYGNNGYTQISKKELTEYYSSFNGHRELSWKDQLGKDLNWALSFDQYKEAETTKHVHRLHPYKGKFIPQLVEYFLDSHTDKFKRKCVSIKEI